MASTAVENVRNRSNECHKSLLVRDDPSLILRSTIYEHGARASRRHRVSESEHRLRHLPFFDELACQSEDSPGWRAAMAGLALLRLVDAWIEDGPRVVAADDFGMRSVRNALDEIESNEKLRS